MATDVAVRTVRGGARRRTRAVRLSRGDKVAIAVMLGVPTVIVGALVWFPCAVVLYLAVARNRLRAFAHLAIVAAAVLVHDFSDGINTVGLILKNRGERKHALRWLIVDAVAPVMGAASTLLFRMPEEGLSIVLAAMSGFFLYIGASDLIPESHHAHPKFLTTVMTLLGAAVLYTATRLASL